MKVLVSACLLGDNTKYNGKNNYCHNLSLFKNIEFIKVCPEVDGGLSIPRSPAEIIGEHVINKDNIDVSRQYYNGAEHALKLCLEHDIKYAILKEKSPSCGINYIYDGTFSSTLINGSGITTRLLKNHNIKVYSENEIDRFLKDIKNEY